MKKAILLILATLVFVSGTLSCAIVRKPDNYKYADTCSFDGISFIGDAFWKDIYEHSEETNFSSSDVLKEGIQMFFSKLDLDLDRLGETKIASAMMSGELGEVRELGKNTLAYISQSYTVYDGVSNTVYIFPSFILADPETQVYVLLRELMLAAIGAKNNTHIEEGIADFYASLFINEADIAISSYAYPNEMMVALWLFSAFGEGEVIRAVREDRLFSLIDQGTKPDMAEKIETALEYLYWGDAKDTIGRDTAINIIYDILAHACLNSGRTEDTTYLLDATRGICDTQGMNLDLEYIVEILRTNPQQKPL